MGIIDIGIGIEYFDDEVLKKSYDLNVLLKYDNENYIVGRVWPGRAVFPDLLHPNISNYF